MSWVMLLVWVVMVMVKVSGQCPSINPLPDVDPWSIRVPSAGFGGITTSTSGVHKDIYLHSPANSTMIGSRLDWGGSVVFFGQTAAPNSSNVIDNHDTGRELQIALYDPDRLMMPCACTASCVTKPDFCPGNGIPYLGWDPVQGGDKCGNGSPINSAGQIGSDTLQVVVAPLQWNPDWQECTCNLHNCSQLQPLPSGVLYTMQFRYVSELVVEVMLEVQNTADLSHNLTRQEFPTIYVAFGEYGLDLPVLLSGNGSQITIPMPADGWGQLVFDSPTPYISFQNAAQDYGIGLLMDQGLNEFQAWTGDGTNAPYFHNMRTTIEFAIPAGGIIRGLSYVGLGDFNTIKDEFEAVIAKRPPFGTVDTPAPPYNQVHNYTFGGNIPISGWVLDNMVGSKVLVYVDGALVTTMPVGSSRPDVCMVYPEYAGCPGVGFMGEISTSTLTKTCSHLLHIVAVDAHGNESPIGDRIFAFN